MGLPTHHIFFLLIICYLMSFSAGTAHLSNETDRQALLAFKDQISVDPHEVLNSWNASLHFCRWQGVSCGRRHQRVTALNLSTLGLVGRFSPHLTNLSFLRTISLPNNSFYGEIPQEVGHLFHLRILHIQNNSLAGVIPASLSNCSQLRFIVLFRNKLVGEVPTELGLLPKLAVLDLGQNNLTGVFPPFLGNVSSLVLLSLEHNNFYGAIPGQVGMLSGLKNLDLGFNNFVGELPPTIYNLSNIERLVFSHNELSGSISPHMGYFFPNLRVVSLDGNHFTGTIPTSLCNASHLEKLELGTNRFHGTIPTDLGKLQDLNFVDFYGNELGTENGDDMLFITSLTNCTKLKTVNANKNQLNGPLPASVANLSNNLDDLILSKNQIYGRIPMGIENILNLKSFALDRNFLTGSIPDGIGKLPKLGILILSANRLSGQIPTSLSNLSQLIALSLAMNQLEGTVTPRFGNCSSLQFLYLNQNNLNGNIPSQIFNLISIINLSLSSNLLKGTLPLEVGNLQAMEYLGLDNNKLSGEIPNTLGKCMSLIYLNLSYNSFAGTIPMSLNTLLGVEEVDFSQNNLSGTIPTFFTEFKLELLNLSFNALEGEVPEQGPFSNASKISMLGNNKLCGGIPELHLPSCQKYGGKNHKRSFLLKVILPLIIGTCIFIFACCIIVWHWRKPPKNKQAPFSSIKKHVTVTYSELHQATNGFSSANLIGSGTFGYVFKGTLDAYQMDIAIKVIRIEQTSVWSFTTECEVLKQIRHRNIVKILTSCSSLDFQGNEFKALVFKYMPNGNLDSWLHPRGDQNLYLSFNQRIDVAIDIARALDYLHNHCETPIVHCDLKPNNILLDEDLVAHVSDFGLAKILLFASNDSSCTSMLKGSIGYIPPEYGIGSKITTQGDVYSFGILLLEMLMGKRPTDEMFNDGVNISKYAHMSYQEKSMEIMDTRLILNENINDKLKFQDCFLSVIKIGIACTTELPQDRTSIIDVCSKLQVIKEVYHKDILGRHCIN